MSLMERVWNGDETFSNHDVIEAEITSIMRGMYGVMLLSQKDNPQLAKIVEGWRDDLVRLRNATRKIADKEKEKK